MNTSIYFSKRLATIQNSPILDALLEDSADISKPCSSRHPLTNLYTLAGAAATAPTTPDSTLINPGHNEFNKPPDFNISLTNLIENTHRRKFFDEKLTEYFKNDFHCRMREVQGIGDIKLEEKMIVAYGDLKRLCVEFGRQFDSIDDLKRLIDIIPQMRKWLRNQLKSLPNDLCGLFDDDLQQVNKKEFDIYLRNDAGIVHREIGENIDNPNPVND